MRKRACACALSFILAATLFPAAAFADDPPASNFTEDWQYQPRYNVTAPVALVFGSEGNGWDIASSNTEKPTAVGTFKNYGTSPISLSQIQYLPIQPEGDTPNAFTGSVQSAIASVEMNHKGSSKNTHIINASTTTPTNITPKPVIVNKSYTDSDNTDGIHSYEFKLNVTAGNIDSSKADAGETAYPFGKLKYVFETGADFFLIDKRDPNNHILYSLPEVKAHAIALSAGTDQDIYDMYYEFVKDDTKYECKIKASASATGANEPLRIVGICQDEKLDKTFAGLTFQFVDVIEDNVLFTTSGEMSRSKRTYNYATTLRNRLNGGADPYSTILSVLGSNVETVRKYHNHNSGNYSDEKIFLPNVAGLNADGYIDRWPNNHYYIVCNERNWFLTRNLPGSFMDGDTEIKGPYMYYYFNNTIDKLIKSSDYWLSDTDCSAQDTSTVAPYFVPTTGSVLVNGIPGTHESGYAAEERGFVENGKYFDCVYYYSQGKGICPLFCL